MPKNEHRPGYKKAKVGWIPDEWKEVALEDIAQIERGKFSARPRNDPKYYGGPYPFLQTGDVSTSDGIVYSYSQTLNASGLAVSKLFPSGTLLVTIAANIGDVAEVPFDFACPDSLVAVQANENIHRFWLKCFLKAKKKYFVSKATQNAQANINLQTIRPTLVQLPPLLEQEAIAAVLVCWDKAIRHLEVKIGKRRLVKQGLMQKLLSGRIRLPGFSKPWMNTRLEGLGVFSKGAGISKEELSTKGAPCIRYGEIYTVHNFVLKEFHSFVNPALAAISVKITANDLLFAGSGETAEEIGKSVAYMGDVEAYAGGDIILLSVNPVKGRADYLSYYLNTIGRRELNKLGQGQSVVHIYPKNLSKVNLALPPLEEQQAIAKVLATADSEIDTLERKLALFKDQKKFLLNNLVAGTIRLPQFCNHGKHRKARK